MHKRSHKIRLEQGRVIIDGKEINLTTLRPIDLLLAALAYGVGIRHMDKTGEPYEVECEIDGYNIVCKAKCNGEEERCLVYRALSEGLLKFICIGE